MRSDGPFGLLRDKAAKCRTSPAYQENIMDNLFTRKLAGLDLSGLTISNSPFTSSDFPAQDAISQTLAAVWSDLFAVFTDTALEADAEDLAWGFVNLFHRAAQRKSKQLDRASDEVRALVASADGSEVHTSNLEEQIERAQAAEASMVAFEEMREVAAALYLDETHSSWKPVSSSRATHGAMLTSAVIQGRDFLKARSQSRRKALMPEGTPIIFADGKGADRLAASWAERRGVAQLTFSLDRRLGARAGFKRNEQMLGLAPRYVIAFPGNGVLERLVIEAKRRRITVVDRRGPLGVSPKTKPADMDS
jgi:hypothetical protein